MYVSLNNEHLRIATINFTVVQVVCFKTIVMDGGSEGPTVKHGIWMCFFDNQDFIAIIYPILLVA